MGNINMVFLTGRVGQDPEIKTFESGSMKASFSMATTKRWKTQDGEKKEETQWHRIETWGGLTKLVEGWVKKGYIVMVTGELVYEKYTDKDGNEREVTKIKANTIDLGTYEKKDGPANSVPSHPGQTPSFPVASDDDDLPF